MRPLTADINFKTKSKLPGPGKYNIQKDNVQFRRSKGYSSGKDKRVTFIDNIMKGSYTPGPNSYSIKNKT